MNLGPNNHFTPFVPYSDLSVSLCPTFRNPCGDYQQGRIIRKVVSVVHGKQQLNAAITQQAELPMNPGTFRTRRIHHNGNGTPALNSVMERGGRTAADWLLPTTGKLKLEQIRITQQVFPKSQKPRHLHGHFRLGNGASDSQHHTCEDHTISSHINPETPFHDFVGSEKQLHTEISQQYRIDCQTQRTPSSMTDLPAQRIDNKGNGQYIKPPEEGSRILCKEESPEERCGKIGQRQFAE